MSKHEPFYIGIGPPNLISDAFELFFEEGELEAYRRLAPFISEEDEKNEGRVDQKLLERFQNLDYHVQLLWLANR